MTTLKTIALTLFGALHALILRIRCNTIESELIFVLLLFVVGWLQQPDGSALYDGRIVITGDGLNIDVLEETFAAYGYTLDKIRYSKQSVPRLIVSDVPEGLKDMRVIDRRKRLFFRTVLPMVLTVNEAIAEDRSRLQVLQQQIQSDGFKDTDLEENDAIWLADLANRYGIEMAEDNVTLSEAVDVLMVRVAPIPTSLALAQAVEESAWGTSRFARNGNALFGQWVWTEEAGIVPEDQQEGQTYAVRAFESPLQSVFGYAKNLNTHWAYADFREKRAAMLKAGDTLDGWALVQTMTRYSERGEDYVKSIRVIMSVNALRPLDGAQLVTQEAMVQLAEAR